MKKTFLFAALAAFSMISCTNNELPEAEVGYGYINLNVTNEVEVTTRNATTPNWIISATKDGNAYSSGIRAGENTVPAGEYIITVQSNSNIASTYASGSWSEPYWDNITSELNGTSISVTAGSTSEVEIACGTPKNSKVTGQFNLTTDFKECNLVLDPTDTDDNTVDRNLTISKKATDNTLTTNGSAYFPASTEVPFTFSYKFKEETTPKSVEGSITTVAGKEHIIRISSNNNGKITLSITNADFADGEDEEFTFDALTGNQQGS